MPYPFQILMIMVLHNFLSFVFLTFYLAFGSHFSLFQSTFEFRWNIFCDLLKRKKKFQNVKKHYILQNMIMYCKCNESLSLYSFVRNLLHIDVCFFLHYIFNNNIRTFCFCFDDIWFIKYFDWLIYILVGSYLIFMFTPETFGEYCWWWSE